jgi:hypothetical protein
MQGIFTHLGTFSHTESWGVLTVESILCKIALDGGWHLAPDWKLYDTALLEVEDEN